VLVNSTGHHDRDRAPTDGTHRAYVRMQSVDFSLVGSAGYQLTVVLVVSSDIDSDLSLRWTRKSRFWSVRPDQFCRFPCVGYRQNRGDLRELGAATCHFPRYSLRFPTLLWKQLQHESPWLSAR
jgi:hypothetical protein